MGIQPRRIGPCVKTLQNLNQICTELNTVIVSHHQGTNLPILAAVSARKNHLQAANSLALVLLRLC